MPQKCQNKQKLKGVIYFYLSLFRFLSDTTISPVLNNTMALRHAYSVWSMLRISHLFWTTRWLWDMRIQFGQCWGYLTCFEQHDGFETCVFSLVNVEDISPVLNNTMALRHAYSVWSMLKISHLFWTRRWLWDMRTQSGQCWGYLTCFEQDDSFDTCVLSLVNVKDISPVLNSKMALRHAYSVWSMLRISHLFWTTRWLWDMRIQSDQCWGYLTCFEQHDGFETCVFSLINVEDISPVLNNTMALRHAYSVWSMLRISHLFWTTRWLWDMRIRSV